MAERLPMRRTIGATEVRNNLGSLLNKVHQGDEHILIEKLGIPVAALISAQEYDQFRRWLTAQMLKDLGRRMGAEAEKQGLTQEQLLEGMGEDREAVYQEMYVQKD